MCTEQTWKSAFLQTHLRLDFEPETITLFSQKAQKPEDM